MWSFNQVRLGGLTIGAPTHSTETNDTGINPSNKKGKKRELQKLSGSTLYRV